MFWENLFFLYAKNKSADQSAQMLRQISAFTTGFMESITF